MIDVCTYIFESKTKHSCFTPYPASLNFSLFAALPQFFYPLSISWSEPSRPEALPLSVIPPSSPFLLLRGSDFPVTQPLWIFSLPEFTFSLIAIHAPVSLLSWNSCLKTSRQNMVSCLYVCCHRPPRCICICVPFGNSCFLLTSFTVSWPICCLGRLSTLPFCQNKQIFWFIDYPLPPFFGGVLPISHISTP